MSNTFKTVFFIILGLILVAIGVFTSIVLIRNFQEAQEPPEPAIAEVETMWTDVLIARRDLFLGDRLTEDDLDLVSLPVELAPRTAISAIDDAVNKIIKIDMVQGQMVLSHNLADPTNNIHDLSFILGDDHVLLAFPAEDLMSRENIIQRGDIIDILATLEQQVQVIEDFVTTNGEPQVTTETSAFTINTLQRIDVTALVVDIIEQEDDTEPTAGNGPTRITNTRAYLLALKPQDALILKHLKDTGAIFDMVLRAPTSTEQFELTPVTEAFINEFFGLEILP